jgi:hypothetical protein
MRRRFALRLYAAIREQETFEQFKKRLAQSKNVSTTEGTVRGWLPPLKYLNLDPVAGSHVRDRDWRALKAPDIATLREVANMLDVSVDYLLGYPVPKRRSDRELVADLAPALVEHVVREAVIRSVRSRREGLAEIVHGQLSPRRSESPFKKVIGAEPTGTQIGDLLKSGEIVVNGLLKLKVQDARQFLEDVCTWVSERAEKWESDHEEDERAEVRAEVRRLQANVPRIAVLEGREPAEIMGILLDAALDPRSPKAQGALSELGRAVATQEIKARAEAEDEARLAEKIGQTFDALQSNRRIRPKHRHAKGKSKSKTR